MLDRFVEGQIREMVMLYPTAKNHQRRSHTILIDASEDKYKMRSPVGLTDNTALLQEESGHETVKRTRNGSASTNVFS